MPTVLAIDDAPLVLTVIKRVFSLRHITAVCCGSAASAIVHLAGGLDPDLLLVDWKLSDGMDGIAFYLYVEKHYPKLIDRFVMLSAYDWNDNADAKKFVEATGCRWFMKPTVGSAAIWMDGLRGERKG